ncbi:MAG TPA: uroporphyrinogen-III synthase [Woeseiaceae bacterium]|nr:uroporphyrinogen-III synthase [Woeseiaceae bacterium]
MPDSALRGFGVLVTRPTAQSAELIDAIEAHGGTALHFPAIDIVPREAGDIAHELADSPPADIALFASRNAVEFGARYAKTEQLGAIGPSTAEALRALGLDVAIEPSQGYDSEHLLQHPALQDVEGKHIRIVRGGDGRKLLANTLRDRGAHVTYLGVYERVLPSPTVDELAAIESAWRSGMIGAITVMSVETLDNLAALLPAWCRSRLDSIPLVTPARRVLKAALDRYPASKLVLAKGPQAADMLDAITSIHKTGSGPAS